MSRRVAILMSVAVWVMAFGGYASARADRAGVAQQQQQQAAQAPGAPARGGRGGWTIPPDAQTLKNPLPVNDALLANGKKLFNSKCRRCHGEQGKGDGEDADEAHQKDMDLTVAERAARNPDGVIFYKVSNGRTNPKMPRFSEELSPEQIWAIVSYVQTLRAK